MKKKGDLLTPALVVGVVSLLIVVVVLFAFLPKIISFFSGGSNEELCTLSILTRATSPEGFREGVRLQCEPDMVCITSKLFGGECKQFAGEEKSRIRTVIVNLNKPAEAKRIIERESADAMFSCWSMTGEGKLDIFGPESAGQFVLDLLGQKTEEPRCIICSRLAIADDVYEHKNSKSVLESVDLNSYLANNKVPRSSLTYLQTFVGSGTVSYQGVEKGVFSRDLTIDDENVAREFGKEGFDVGDVIRTDELAFVFSQVKFKETDAFESGANAALVGGIIVGGVLLLTPAGPLLVAAAGPAYATLIGLGAVGATAGFAGTVEGVGVAVTENDNQNVAVAHCGELVSQSENKVGCSLIKPVAWKASTINNLCSGGIEGGI